MIATPTSLTASSTSTTPAPRAEHGAGRTRTAIVGGGFLGLQLAANLTQSGQAVTVFEAAPHLGGLADAWQVGSLTWDRHYHVILMSDLRVRQLLEELQLAEHLRWVETRTGFYTDGQLVSMSNSLEFLRFPPLNLLDKVRLASTILYASKIQNWQKLEAIPVADWLRKWSGRRTTEKIWLPLLRAKLGENYRHASAAFIWAIIARMYAARRTGLKKEQFGYVRGGYARIVAGLEQRLRSLGVTIQTGSRIREIRSDASPVVHFADGSDQAFDRVIVTTAAPVATKLVPQLSEAERQAWNGIRYQGIVCASLVLKKPLAHYYVTNITDTWVPFTAVIEMTALVDPAEFAGQHLVYLPKYVSPDDPLFEQSDEAIRESFVSALQRMYPHLTPEDVTAFRVSRVRNVLAISTLHYSQNLPPMSTSVPGVSVVNSAHIVNGTLNINETLLLADRATAHLLAEAQA